MDVPELLPDAFLRKVNRAIDGFAVPPPHHVCPVSPVQLLSALLKAKYVFVHEMQLYRPWHHVIEALTW